MAGIATYVLAGELALGRVLAGELPRPGFPPRLRQTAPRAWFRLAAGALHFAEVHAGRQDRVACLANLCQAVLATAQGRLAAAGEWVLNESGLSNGPACTPSRTGSRTPSRTWAAWCPTSGPAWS